MGSKKDNTNATYETTDAQTKNYTRGTTLEQSVGKYWEGMGDGT